MGIQPCWNPLTRNCSPSSAWGESTVILLSSADMIDPPADWTAAAKLTVRPSYGANVPAYPSSPYFGATVSASSASWAQVLGGCWPALARMSLR